MILLPQLLLAGWHHCIGYYLTAYFVKLSSILIWMRGNMTFGKKNNFLLRSLRQNLVSLTWFPDVGQNSGGGIFNYRISSQIHYK